MDSGLFPNLPDETTSKRTKLYSNPAESGILYQDLSFLASTTERKPLVIPNMETVHPFLAEEMKCVRKRVDNANQNFGAVEETGSETTFGGRLVNLEN
jgi:hypothetical protein